MRLVTVLHLVLFSMVSTPAAENSDNEYVMSFELTTRTPDGGVGYSNQLQGIHLLGGKAFHGDDLGELDYFFTVSGTGDGKGRLTIEIYRYESRRKTSDIILELVSEVDFTLGSPARYEAKNDQFGIDLAFSINHE